jgi:hypothetical protein
MLKLTTTFSDQSTETVSTTWFTVTYHEDLKAPIGGDDCPTDVIKSWESDKSPATITEVQTTLIEEESDGEQMYLHLWHGRKEPDERLNDWGFDGPCLGPLREATFTQAGGCCLQAVGECRRS